MTPELIQEAIKTPEVINAIMAGAPMGVVKDICLMSILFILAKMIRIKVKFFQNFFIPVSVIAGLLGLILGPQVLKLIPFSTFIGKYPWILIVTLFATFPFGPKKSESVQNIIQKSGASFFYNLWAEVSQFALASVIGLFILSKIWPVHVGFAWTLPAGFAGGHGYATAIGTTLSQFDFENAVTVGMTMATIGLLSAVFGGVLLINFATRKGYTRIIKETSQLPMAMRTGLVPTEDRPIMGKQTVSSISIDPLCWHLALTMAAVWGGFYMTKVIGAQEWLYIGGKSLYMPEMSTAMIAGIVINRLLRLFKLDAYIDKDVMTRIGSSASDYLVGFGIASINISVVVTYWQPILFLVVIGLAWVVFNLFVIAPRVFKDYWFENGIFTYGWSTGAVAFGVVLLRIVDPDFISETLSNYGLAYIVIAPIEIFIVALGPVFYCTFGLPTTIVFVLAAIGLLVAMRVLFWHKPQFKAGAQGKTTSISS